MFIFIKIYSYSFKQKKNYKTFLIVDCKYL